MIFARRSRSASAWRAIARCMPLGISTSFTATAETLMPHGPVASSMISCRIALIFSRSESSSSSTCWPSTDLSVVCAFCDVATMKFSTCTTALFGSTMRKYATALTRTGTLSFVITSCGGMFNVIVRRSTFTIWSTNGIFQTTPGPRVSSRRPRRNITPRSYSRMIRTKPSTTATLSLHGQFEPLDVFDLDFLAGDELGVVLGPRLPQLTVDEYEAGRPHFASLADDRLWADGHWPPPRGESLAER